MAPIVWHPDVTNHIDWGIRFYEYGINNFYAPESNVWSFTWPNQPPGTILIFAAIRKIYEGTFSLVWTLNTAVAIFPSVIVTIVDTYLYPVLLKVPAILSDLGIAYLIYKFLNKFNYKKFAEYGALFFLFNPVIWYNSSVWGQTDAIISFFALLSLWFIFDKKPTLSALALAASLYIKLSLIIFIPIYAILFFRQKFTIKQIAVSAALPLIVFSLITLPFSYPENPLTWLFDIYREKVLTNQLQVITANAFNFWAALTGIVEQPHSLRFLGATYQVWGGLLFAIAYIPLLYKLYRKPSFENTIWVLCLTAFSSFMLLTNMHERYLYPMFPFITMLAVISPSIMPIYLSISAVNFLNLYHLWFVPRFSFSEIIFSTAGSLFPRALSIFSAALYLYIMGIFWQRKADKI
jgi:hypothetical protein